MIVVDKYSRGVSGLVPVELSLTKVIFSKLSTARIVLHDSAVCLRNHI